MLQHYQQRRRGRFLVLKDRRWAYSAGLILLVSLSSVTQFAEANKAKKKEYPDYIYQENAGLVKEYSPDSETNPERPAFLFSGSNGPRVVEFYSPVCPHCRKFRDQYVELAERVNRIVREEQEGATATGQNEPIEFHAISCRPNHALCKSFGLKSFPQFKLFAANATNETQSIGLDEVHPLYILEKLGVRADHDLKLSDSRLATRPMTVATGTTTRGPSADSAYNRAIQTVQTWLELRETAENDAHHHMAATTINLNRTKQQIFNDAYMSFDYTLRNSIFTSNGPLEKDSKQAFRRWLELLQRSLPRPFVAQHVAQELLANFEDVSMAEEKLIAILDDDKFDRPVGEWSPGCTKGVVGMGYTCGLWSLFHIVSVGMVEWNSLLPPSTSRRERPMAIPSGKAADTLRDFIDHFFNCDECRTHFIKEYDSCSLDRCNLLLNTGSTVVWRRFPVWLAAVHNSVSERLATERDDETIKKNDDTNDRRWPLPQVCPTCSTEDEYHKWDENHLYKFLRVEYWPEDSTTAAYRNDLGLPRNQAKVEREETQMRDVLLPGPVILSWIRPPVLWVFLVAVAIGLRTQKGILGRRKRLLKKLHSLDLLDGGDPSDHEVESMALSPRKSPRRRLMNEKPANMLSPRRPARARQEDLSAAQETDDETEASSLVPVTAPYLVLIEGPEKAAA